MKFSVTLSDLTAQEAALVVSTFGNGAGNASGSAPASAPAQTQTPPVPTAPTATGAPTPPPSAPAGGVPTAPAAPGAPPPPPAPPQATANPQTQAVLTAMQAYSGTHKAAGVKKVLGLCNLERVTDATPQQLEWLLQAFNSNATPQQLGAA